MRWMGHVPTLVLAVGCAYAAQQPSTSPIGKWTGQSLCTVKPSACHDEEVVYEISAPSQKKDVLVMKADKIVAGQRQWMGDLDCKYAEATHVLTCEMPKGVWSFDVSGDTMSGTLKLSDGTLFRKVSVKRAK